MSDSTSVAKPELTHTLLCSENGENYNPSDNSTFKDKPLQNNPRMDIALRLKLKEEHDNPKKSGSFMYSTSRGNRLFSDISPTFGENRVLHLPKDKDFSQCVKIKEQKCTTFLPPSLVRRYKLEKSPTYAQTIPIFFDCKKEVFFATMDERLLLEITPAESDFLQSIPNLAVRRSNKYSSNGRAIDFVTLQANSLSELSNILKQFAYDSSDETRIYRQFFVNFNHAERVIVVHFDQRSKINEDGLFNKKVDEKFETTHKMHYCFYQAAKIDSTLYLIDKDGNIDKSKTSRFDPSDFISKNEGQIDSEGIMKSINLDRRSSVSLMMPYNDKDWHLLNSFHERMTALLNELEALFSSTKSDNERGISASEYKLDGSLSKASLSSMVKKLGFSQ